MNISSLINEIEKVVSPGGILQGEDVTSCSDSWPPLGGCEARAIIRPTSTLEVSEIVKLCHAAGQTIVTHGGLTGLVGGAKATKLDIVISLERINGIEPVDVINRTLIVEAGVPLQQARPAIEHLV